MSMMIKKGTIAVLTTGLITFSFVGSSSAEERVGSSKVHTKAQSVSLITTGSATALQLAQKLAAPGVTVSNAVLTGNTNAAGQFSASLASIGLDSGVVLSSGRVADVVGPNSSGGTGTDNGTAGDADLDALGAGVTQDAVVLEFDFVPTGNSISFSYVFSSEEYNEFVGSSFNDVFGFFVNGTNCALVNGSPVSINTINAGSNAGSYIDNTAGALDTEMDGLTTVLQCNATVNAGVSNHLKLAIADVSDGILDSAVFILANSVGAPPPAPVEAIPSLSFWGKLILLASLLLLGLGLSRRRS